MIKFNNTLLTFLIRFILHRLKIPKRTAIEQVKTPRIKITLLSRNTQYRRILNEQALLDELRSSPRQYAIQRVHFAKTNKL